VGSEVLKVALGQVFLAYSSFPMPLSFHYHSILTFHSPATNIIQGAAEKPDGFGNEITQ